MTEQITVQKQLNALAALVDDWAVKKNRNVKGQFTSGDYVTFRLNQIFTPAGWQFTILAGPTVVTLSETNAYTRLVGRLTIRFADGAEVHQDDIGIWPLKATNARNGGVLRDTAPERYETAEKAARTDCLKNAARNLGTCFAPQTDLELLAHIKRQAHLASGQAETGRSATQAIADLFGEEKLSQSPPEPEPEEDEEKTPTNGLDRLLEEVNQKLAANGLEQYKNKANMIKTLKAIGHRKYAVAAHATMVSQLIAKKEPNGH